MFIEVYTIPLNKWNNNPNESKLEENKQIININRIIRVRTSNKCDGRAELHLRDNVITVVGTYKKIVKRINETIKLNEISRLPYIPALHEPNTKNNEK